MAALPGRTHRRLRIGLVASRLHRSGPTAALFRLLKPLEAAIGEELQPELEVVGQTAEALTDGGILVGYAGLRRLPARCEGGLIHLVGDVVSDDATERAMCVSDRASAEAWIRDCERRAAAAWQRSYPVDDPDPV